MFHCLIQVRIFFQRTEGVANNFQYQGRRIEINFFLQFVFLFLSASFMFQKEKKSRTISHIFINYSFVQFYIWLLIQKSSLLLITCRCNFLFSFILGIVANKNNFFPNSVTRLKINRIFVTVNHNLVFTYRSLYDEYPLILSLESLIFFPSQRVFVLGWCLDHHLANCRDSASL